jgi:hypothetical protein
MAIDKRRSARSNKNEALSTAPYLAKIVGHLDPTFQGGLEVTLLRESGNEPRDETQTYFVKYAPPFYGNTAYEFTGKNDSYNDTQKSYGFWAVPPDVGVTGIVIFIDGKADNGFWLACVQDKFIDHMIPAIAASKSYHPPSEELNQGPHPLPVAEYNKKTNTGEKNLEIDKINKPVHPIAKRFAEQGLIKDEFRGYSYSSARRDLPGTVFGMSTPGPLDRLGPKRKIGTLQSETAEPVPISRLGGTQFVMDDGDDRYFRTTPPFIGPPEYKELIKEGLGEPEHPYSEYFRVRTRTGHQILLHNSEDLIYIGNSRGTAWIELTSNGKIDIYSRDSISIHTENDFNFFCDRDFNLEVGRNFNLKVRGERHSHILKDDILIVDKDNKILIKENQETNIFKQKKEVVGKNVDINHGSDFAHTVKGNLSLNTSGFNHFTAGANTEIRSGGQHIETASVIHMNGPSAATAKISEIAEPPKSLSVHSLPEIKRSSGTDWQVRNGSGNMLSDDVSGGDVTDFILRRIPTHEPYPHHENLEPELFLPDKTDRDINGRFSA